MVLTAPSNTGLPADADLDAPKALVAPIVDRMNEVTRVDGDRMD